MYEDDEEEVRDCECGCGRPLGFARRWASMACRQRARQRAERERLHSGDEGTRVTSELLEKIISEEAVLTEEQEAALSLQIQIAKREMYLRRGGADRELQLAHDHGEIYPE